MDGILNFLRNNKAEVENININFGRQEDKAMMAEVLKTIPDVTITSSFDHNLEIGGRTTSKADAVLHLCEILDIHQDHTMAIGDSPNDEADASGCRLPGGHGQRQGKHKGYRSIHNRIQ